ncbi:MAG: cyclic nucleotide-binding domain-containing protein [Ilumatobacter sp.]
MRDPAPLIDAVQRAGMNRSLAAGETLCSEGDESHEAYVVVDGSIEACVIGHGGEMVIASHGVGAIIGEVTTLIGGHRTATLRAVTPSVVAVIERNALHDVFNDYPDAGDAIIADARERTDRSRVAALLSEELQAPDGDVVAAIADRVTWTSLEAGDTLFRRGDAADAAYLVMSGRLGVTDLGPNSTHGDADAPFSRNASDTIANGPRNASGQHESRPIEVGRGGIVGEFGLLENRARSASVVALRDTALARLSAEDFADIAHDHSALAMGLVRRVLDRSGSDTSTTSTQRSFAIAVTANLTTDVHDQLISTVMDTLHACGNSVHLSASSVDTALRQPGLANTPAGGFGEIRLAELLHQAETDADHLVLDTRRGLIDSDAPDWTRRALRHADQVVIVSSPDPDDAEDAAIRALLESTPDRIPRWLAVFHPESCSKPSGTRALRERFGVDEVHHLRGVSPTEVARMARLAAGAGIGLVLSGGGARGHAHIGVYTVLHELGVPVDRVVGASMGSIVAGGIGQQLSPANLLADMQRGADNLLDYTVPLVSLIKGERIVAVLERQFDGWDVDDMWIPFTCVSTDLTTAAVVTHRTGPAARAIRTSIAIPGVLPPVAHDGHLLADGGVLDNLPVGDFASDPSIGVIIACDVAPPIGPRAKGDFGLSVSGWTVARRRFVPKPIHRAIRRMRSLVGRENEAAQLEASFPGLGTTLLRSLLIGSSRSRDEHLASGAIDLYLELDLRDVPLLDFAQVVPAADAGLEQSRAPITQWLAARSGSPWGESLEPELIAGSVSRPSADTSRPGCKPPFAHSSEEI